MENKSEEKKEEAIAEVQLHTPDSVIPADAELTKVIIVDFTSFSMRGERVFFGKRMEEVKLELMQHCETTVVHKKEEKSDKPLEIVSVLEENTFNLLKARRLIIKVAKAVINEKISKKLMKKSDDLDDIIINDNLH
jgi:flagellar basal body-associated protein FliL